MGAHRSWGFRGLQMAERQLFQGCNWKIGNGSTLKTFSTTWLHGRIPVAKGVLPLRQIMRSRVNDLIDVEN